MGVMGSIPGKPFPVPSPHPPAVGWLSVRECGASGSEFEARGSIRAGSDRITVEDIGDFEVGQWVTVSRCNVHHYGTVYNTAEPYYGKNQSPLRDEVELRGLDDGKSWQVFVVHFEKTDPVTFSWLVVDPAFQPNPRRWTWQGRSLPITGDWVTLADGVQMRFRKLDWLPGQSVSFHARNRLIAQITAIDGKTLTLNERAGRDASEAVVRHLDQEALQAAVDRAIAERKALFIPSGRYRLTNGLWIRNASLRVEGEHRDHTVLDVSEEHAAVFWIAGGRDVAVRNLSMVGHADFMAFPELAFQTASGGYAFWPTAHEQMDVKGCAAANMVSTEHLLFEDLKVTRMASEAFYLHGSDRFGSPPYVQTPHEGMPELRKQYTKSCVYHRCHVSDCSLNAFNNNDFAENTSILHCHVERVGNFCEQSNRFTRISGNYVGPSRYNTLVHCGVKRRQNLVHLGSSQAIISDNVFEGGADARLYRGLCVAGSAVQVIIANNLFVNFGRAPAITISDATPAGGFPTRSITVSGNVIDLTQVGESPDSERTGISVAASNVIIADNQIYVRGAASDKVTGINVADHCVNVQIHDNIVQNCGYGFRTGNRAYAWQGDKGDYTFTYSHTESEIVDVVGRRVFRDRALPCAWDWQQAYQGWTLRWLSGANVGETATIESYDPENRTVTLKEETPLEAGDRFAVAPAQTNWNVHHNTIDGSLFPVVLDVPGGDTLLFKDNIITRGSAVAVKHAILLGGESKLSGNEIAGFDEPGFTPIEKITGQ